MNNREQILDLLLEAENALGKLKLARRGLTGLLARKFWRQIDNAWSAVHFATKFWEEENRMKTFLVNCIDGDKEIEAKSETEARCIAFTRGWKPYRAADKSGLIDGDALLGVS